MKEIDKVLTENEQELEYDDVPISIRKAKGKIYKETRKELDKWIQTLRSSKLGHKKYEFTYMEENDAASIVLLQRLRPQ